MKTFITTLCLAASLLAVGCTNVDNSKLTRNASNSNEFKQTLAAEMAEHPDSFDYTLAGYQAKDGKEYLNVDITRADFKTTIAVAVNKWDKIEGIKSTKGMGYSGAELKGLKLALVNDNEFQYLSLDKVND